MTGRQGERTARSHNAQVRMGVESDVCMAPSLPLPPALGAGD